MPISAYYKGSGLKVKREMQQRYGDKWKDYFYGKAAKMRMRPTDAKNLVRPKKGWRKGQRARVLAAMKRLKARRKAHG